MVSDSQGSSDSPGISRGTVMVPAQKRDPAFDSFLVLIAKDNSCVSSLMQGQLYSGFQVMMAPHFWPRLMAFQNLYLQRNPSCWNPSRTQLFAFYFVSLFDATDVDTHGAFKFCVVGNWGGGSECFWMLVMKDERAGRVAAKGVLKLHVYAYMQRGWRRFSWEQSQQSDKEENK